MFKPLASALVAVLGVFAVGCGRGGSGGNIGPVDDSPRSMLQELAEVLLMVAEAKQKPPTALPELQRYGPAAPLGIKGVAEKKIVYIWGATRQPSGEAVVAYQAGADKTGGWVLLEGGEVKQMSAAEFAAAPKAGKK